jgi:hypothetical protein
MTFVRAKWIRLAATGLFLLTAWGCARPLAFISHFRRERPPTVESLTAPLRRRFRPVKTLWLRARVRVRQPGRPGQGIFDATILAEFPDLLRLRAYRNATILVFDFLANEKELRLHDALSKQYYSADYETLRRSRSPWSGLTPSLLIQALLVDQTVLDRILSARSATVRRRWKTLEVSCETADGNVRIVFDRAGGQIVGLTYRSAAGGKPTRVDYGEMVDVEGVRLPRWVEVEHGPSRMRLRLDVLEYKVNPPLSPEVFAIRLPAGQSWWPLETLR